MEKPERLRFARAAAGFESASEAARSLGINPGTYIHHENGTRDFGYGAAERYGRKFHATPEWLLYERGHPPERNPHVSDEDVAASLSPKAARKLSELRELETREKQIILEKLMAELQASKRRRGGKVPSQAKSSRLQKVG